MQGHQESVQAMAYMGGPTDMVPNGRGGGKPSVGGDPPKPHPPKREVKPKGFKSQANTKIKLCAAKLMDVKYWLNKVNESSL